jgi:hypothetical protein
MNTFDIWSRMVERDDKAIEIAPLGNVTRLQKVKEGTNVTIGVSGDRIGSIYQGKFIGGLVLCDKKRFDEVKAEMEAEAAQALAAQPAAPAANLAAMREVERATRERATLKIIRWPQAIDGRDHLLYEMRTLPPLTDAELIEIWERSQ